MQTLRLGQTNLTVSRLAFGALPIQRIPLDDAVAILRRAFAAGVTFYDTARAYTDSEEKLGAAFAGMRDKIVIATKTKGETGDSIREEMATSLAKLGTDYVDIYQVHNPKSVPTPDDGTGRYEALLELREQGRIRHIGITSHSLEKALAAVKSGLYATLQFPFSLLADDKEIELVRLCEQLDVGFLGMKGVGGGLIRNIPATFAFTRRFANVLPLWGIQRMEELEEFLALDASPPAWDQAMEQAVGQEKEALGKSFCRACAYCMPCPEGIDIPGLARLMLMVRRSPWQPFTTEAWQKKVAHARDSCTGCGLCQTRCPYELEIPRLVADNAAAYADFMREKDLAAD